VIGIKNITIVEKSAELGGLLKSISIQDPIDDGQDYVFDYGTHFILKTGDPEIDTILDSDLSSDSFHTYKDSLPEGQFLNGQLYPHSGCANATLFSQDVYDGIYKGIAERTEQKGAANGNNLNDVIVTKYGQAVADNIYGPALQKFTGAALEDLDPSLESAFTSGRVILFDREKSIEQKQKPEWDNVIAYAHYEDGTSSFLKHYPKQGGVELWITEMIDDLRNAGVRILTKCEITSVELINNKIQNITLSNEEQIQTDLLLWTIPAVFASRLLDIQMPSAPPKMRSVSVVNIITDKKPIAGPYWITVYDSAKTSFRVTLYDNYQPSDLKSRISVEVLHEKGHVFDDCFEQNIFDELKEMKIIDNDASLLWCNTALIPNGFSVSSPGDLEIYNKQEDHIHSSVQNMHVVSRYRSGHHGQISIMKNIHDFIKSVS